MTTPSALNTALAEEALRCNGGIPKCYCGVGLVVHSFACPAAYLPAVALALQSKDDSASVEIDRLKGEIGRLTGLLNTPETEDFLEGVRLESAHQVQRWGDEHDRSKSAENWFWLIAYLSGKALRAHIDGDTEKALHHCISSAAALKQWHASIRAGIINGQDADLAALQTEGEKL